MWRFYHKVHHIERKNSADLSQTLFLIFKERRSLSERHLFNFFGWSLRCSASGIIMTVACYRTSYTLRPAFFLLPDVSDGEKNDQNKRYNCNNRINIHFSPSFPEKLILTLLMPWLPGGESIPHRSELGSFWRSKPQRAPSELLQ